MPLHNVTAALLSAHAVLMSLHRAPDGDSIGATLAMQEALRALGKRVDVASPDALPFVYDFLPGSGDILSWADVTPPYDTVFLLDCADEARTGAPKPLHDYAPLVINVDHHPTNQGYGDICHIDGSAAAVGEVAAHLIDALGVDLSPTMALGLYTAVSTDTGGFRYASTTAETHLLAARWLKVGVDPGRVSQALYEQNSVAGLRLLGRALSHLTVEPDFRLAHISLSSEDFCASAATAADVETLGLVNYARSLAGVEVAALFRPEGADVKCSLRSKGEFDVGAFALAHGGGGHSRAAGLTLPQGGAMRPEHVLQALRQELRP